MNLRTAKLEWDLTPTLYEDENSHCLLIKLAQNACGEVYLNPCDHNMGFFYVDSHYLDGLLKTLESDHWFDVSKEHLPAVKKLARTILEYIEKNPTPDGHYCFLASDEF